MLITFALTGNCLELLASTGDCLKLFASEGDCASADDFVTSMGALDLADNPGTTSLYLEYFDFQVHSRTSCLHRLKLA